MTEAVEFRIKSSAMTVVIINLAGFGSLGLGLWVWVWVWDQNVTRLLLG